MLPRKRKTTSITTRKVMMMVSKRVLMVLIPVMYSLSMRRMKGQLSMVIIMSMKPDGMVLSR